MKKIIFFSILLFVFGCAKSVIMKHAEIEARAMCEEEFYEKYHALVTNEEKNKLKQIKTILECNDFIEKFWLIRDTDPETPENEFRKEKEQLAENIENEILARRTFGILFKSHGGFMGEMAKIYMLHGPPDYIETTEGNTFVNLMVWIYGDNQGKHKYRFLFYQKNGIGQYFIFRPQWDALMALEEIGKFQPVNPYEVYEELIGKGAYLFLAALVSFSDNPDIRLENALKPPIPASEIAKKYAPETRGGIYGKNKIEKESLLLNSKNATISAHFSIEIQKNGPTIKILINHKDIDWILKNGELWSKILSRIIIINSKTQEVATDERILEIVSSKEKIETGNSFSLFDIIPKNQIKGDKFNVIVYLKMLEPNTGKYIALTEEVKK